jgi:hypothetical protein
MTKLFAGTIQDMSTTKVANVRVKHAENRHNMKQIQEVSNEKVNSRLNRQHKGSDLVKISQLIDLTDKPIRLAQDEICASQVRASASNCICCCCNNSITLVTTDESYVLDHIPFDNITMGQANASLQYLALANDNRLGVIDLIESDACRLGVSANFEHKHGRDARSSIKLVDLASVGLTMRDILLWRWIDDNTLALVSRKALYVCQVDGTHISHPALTALNRVPTQLLSLQHVCSIHPDLADDSCRITDVHRDASTNLYAVSGICRRPTKPAVKLKPSQRTSSIHYGKSRPAKTNNNNNNNNDVAAANLRPNSFSVPGRLSMLANHNDEQHSSNGSIKSENFFSIESLRRATKICQPNPFAKRPGAQSVGLGGGCGQQKADEEGELSGITQIHCRLRDCSQLIRAHSVAFATTTAATSCYDRTSDCSMTCGESDDDDERVSWTTLVAANRIEDKLKVYFIGMATTSDLSTSGQNVSRSLEFNRSHEGKLDIPVAIVCSKLDPDNEKTHAAMIVTRFGHLIVCSVAQGSILFNVQISNHPICGAILEDKSAGIMVICNNGQVLLVRVDEEKFYRLLKETRGDHMRGAELVYYYASSSNIDDSCSEAESAIVASQNRSDSRDTETGPQRRVSEETESVDTGIEIVISTRL